MFFFSLFFLKKFERGMSSPQISKIKHRNKFRDIVSYRHFSNYRFEYKRKEREKRTTTRKPTQANGDRKILQSNVPSPILTDDLIREDAKKKKKKRITILSLDERAQKKETIWGRDGKKGLQEKSPKGLTYKNFEIEERFFVERRYCNKKRPQKCSTKDHVK